MTHHIIDKVEAKFIKKDLPALAVGDTVDVHSRIIEGEKERIQVFSGVILSMTGKGVSKAILVRRIVANEGVERTFPIHSPKVAKIEVKRHGHARRSKLYYLRDRVGKARRLRDRQHGFGEATAEPVAETAATVAAK
jgi:large subunit ribosomal protein L19